MPRLTLRIWMRALRRRHVRALIAHPHHYAVAVGLSGFLVSTGHKLSAAVSGAFGYALLENLCADVAEAAEREAAEVESDQTDDADGGADAIELDTDEIPELEDAE